MYADEITALILRSPELRDAIMPCNIVVYGILLSGSRFFGLDMTYEDGSVSDYDLNVIVRTEDYRRLSKIPARYYQKFIIDGIRIHWHYIPVDFNYYDFNGYCGLEWWFAITMCDISAKLIYVADWALIDKFIESVSRRAPEIKAAFISKYKNDKQLMPANILACMHVKSYLFMLISELMQKTSINIRFLKAIKLLTHSWSKLDMPLAERRLQNDLIDYVMTNYSFLNGWLNGA